MHADLEGLDARALRERPQLALDLERVRRIGDDDAVPVAHGTANRENLAGTVRDVLPCHLDQPERRDLDDVGLRPISLELRAQGLLDGLPVLRVRHVDEVDDDDAADVAEAELPDDLLHGLEVVLHDRVLEAALRALPARPDEPARVDVDDGERLRVVEDEVTARGEIDTPIECRANLGVDAGRLEERLLLAVPVDALDHVRRRLLQIADDASVRAVVVDAGPDEVACEEIPDDPERQLRLLVHEQRRRCVFRLRLDRLPEALQEDEIALDVLGRRALGCSADDDPATLGIEPPDDLLQSRPLGILESPRDAEALAVRDVDEKATWERDLGREASALRLHRILDGLHHDRLAALDQILNLPRALAPLELGADDLVDVQKAVLLETDLDERGLHPRKHVVDDPEVDVPGDRPALRTLEVDLGDAVVLQDRNPLLADVDGDHELALRCRQRRTLRRCAPTVAAARLLPVGLAIGLGRLLRPRGRHLLGDCNAALGQRVGVTLRRGRRRRLLPSLSATTPAAAPLLRACRRALLVPGLRHHWLCVQSL